MESTLYSAHKPIRNKIRTYHAIGLVDLAIRKIGETEARIPDNGGYLPWELMLLIRWALQYDDPRPSRKIPAENDMNYFINAIKGLYGPVTLPGEEGENRFIKTIRRILLQQLPYQVRRYDIMHGIGRQLLLFEDIGSPYRVSEKFKELTGFSILEFLMLSFGVFTLMEYDRKREIKVEDFSRFYEPEIVRAYLDFISLTPQQAKDYLSQDAKNKGERFILQLYEISPLVRHPLLKMGGKYYCYSHRLYNYFFVHYIYDFLRAQPDRFNDFGGILEKYIGDRLDHLKLSYIPDKAWSKILGRQIQVPDFTFSFQQATIFIEAKGKELPDIPRVYQTNDSLRKNLDDSLVKGVVQIYSLAHAIMTQKPNQIQNTETFFGMVVSYKEYLFKGGKGIWDEFMEEEVGKRLQNLGIDRAIIPPDNLFFISIEDFDYLIAFMKDHPKTSLPQIFEQAKSFEANPTTSSFFFRDHVRRMSPSNTLRSPDYLGERFDAVPQGLYAQYKGDAP